MGNNMTRVLVIEDDEEVGPSLQSNLLARNYDTQLAITGTQGLEAATKSGFDVMIVDRMLPELDGLSLIGRLREQNIQTPALVLSALGAVDDRIEGLRAGGDDYLVKPFSLEELVARIEALVRRPVSQASLQLRAGPLRLDLLNRTLSCEDKTVDLLAMELKLLEYMMRRPDQVVTRAMLLEDIWRYRFLPETNLVDVHMGKLRRKLAEAGGDGLIHTVRGAGFMLRIPSETSSTPSA
ncbi:response regulator transcription factor [Granulibacter bethesdensis]|uniref:response regulator transcription factor n=2 Tax=Granulibacter bethesdensis TaxID=364410 RepID=UPI0003F2135F|nr:response regulator transcription factor [Granulibacter bethesdensis]AHJ65869.1 Two-component response regulator [Granulibacter bethesdensis CGDNIH4]APH52402.1 Two-component response regulator [Granulibacter bethesdensis]APH60006.1 Two-component response regulator [Granulibacter bethesdensis]